MSTPIELLSIVVPCFNEEENIPLIERELFGLLKGLGIPSEVVFVDDGSKDATPRLLKDLTEKHRFVRVETHPRNLGLGRALRSGIKSAKGDAILTLDADLSFHPDEIPRLMEKYRESGADCVIGSPHLGALKTQEKHRELLSRGANLLYTVFLDPAITCATAIFRIYKAQSIHSLAISSEGFTINSEILFLMKKSRMRIVEIPSTLGQRRYGTSKILFVPAIWEHLKLISRIILWRILPF